VLAGTVQLVLPVELKVLPAMIPHGH
jgi:hypothetical protein